MKMYRSFRCECVDYIHVVLGVDYILVVLGVDYIHVVLGVGLLKEGK
jgi:hypothetical protein